MNFSMKVREEVFGDVLFELSPKYNEVEEVYAVNRTTAFFESAEDEGLIRKGSISFEDQNAFVDGSFGKENRYLKTLKSKLSILDQKSNPDSLPSNSEKRGDEMLIEEMGYERGRT